MAEFMYKCTEYYAPEYDRSLLWNDPELNIKWPFSGVPELSEKDTKAKLLAEAEIFI